MDFRTRLFQGFALLSLAVWAGRAVGEDIATPAVEWQGEYFEKTQGGAFLRVGLRGFKAGPQTKFMTGDVRIMVYSVLSKKTIALTLSPSEQGPPAVVFKLPSGKYDLRRVSLVDASGIRRTFESGGKPKSFVVKRQSLSNLGLWLVSPSGKNGLSLETKKIPNFYKERGDRKDSSVAVVVDGFTGLVQEELGGRDVKKGAADNYASKSEMRATLTFTREIAMFYAVNLFKHNAHARAVADTLAVYDANLRRCYTTRLEDNDNLRGTAIFTFILSKETGTMIKLGLKGGTLTDAKLAQCLYLEMGHIQFPVAQTMIGEVTYTFDVR